MAEPDQSDYSQRIRQTEGTYKVWLIPSMKFILKTIMAKKELTSILLLLNDIRSPFWPSMKRAANGGAIA